MAEWAEGVWLACDGVSHGGLASEVAHRLPDPSPARGTDPWGPSPPGHPPVGRRDTGTVRDVRWGPVVASVVAALGLIGAGFVGISVFDADVGEEFGLVRLDGLLGETLLVLAIALVGLAVVVALRRAPAGALFGLGSITAVVAFLSRSSLVSDAESVTEYIVGAGSAQGTDSRLVAAASGRVTRVDVDGAVNLLAMAAASALVVVGWSAWVELDERRRARAAGAAGTGITGVAGAEAVDRPDLPGSDPITDSSQVPHT